LHTHKQVAMQSNVTPNVSAQPAQRVSFASLAKAIDKEDASRLKSHNSKPAQQQTKEEETNVEDDWKKDVFLSTDEFDETHNRAYANVQRLYQQCCILSRSATMPLFDVLSFNELFAFMYPSIQSYHEENNS